MKDEELKLEEIEVSLTRRQTMSVWVTTTDESVHIRERGGGGRGSEGVVSEALSLLSYTLGSWFAVAELLNLRFKKVVSFPMSL